MKRGCQRCAFTKIRPAVEERSFILEDRLYRLWLCSTHAGVFDRDLWGWANLAVDVDEDDEPSTPVITLRSVPTPVAAPSEPVLAPVSRRSANQQAMQEIRDIQRRARAADQARSLIANVCTPIDDDELRPLGNSGIEDTWRIRVHAHERARERFISGDEILKAAVSPETVFKKKGDSSDVWRHRRGNLCVVVNTTERFVITAFWVGDDQMAASQ